MLSLATTERVRPYGAMKDSTRSPAARDPQLSLYGRALKVLRMRRRLTQADAAAALRLTTQAWQNYEAGQRRSAFALDSLEALTAAVGSTPDEFARVADLLKSGVAEGLLSDPGHPLPTAAPSGEVIVFAPPGQPESSTFRREALAPVYGAVHAGDPSAIAFTPDHPDDWKPLHPNQLGYRDPFYLEVHGESMSPRFEPGEKAPAVRGVQPGKGQVCVVEMHDGAMILKYYMGRTEDALRLSELNPAPREFTVHLADVRAVHAVVGGAVN